MAEGLGTHFGGAVVSGLQGGPCYSSCGTAPLSPHGGVELYPPPELPCTRSGNPGREATWERVWGRTVELTNSKNGGPGHMAPGELSHKLPGVLAEWPGT